MKKLADLSDMPKNTVDFDPRQRAIEAFGRSAGKLAGSAIEVGISSARSLQNSLYPDEFEYYALTLELVDSTGLTLEHLTFPVMPENITYDDMKVLNVQKTLGGVTATDNQSYTPKTIGIQGTFGRSFKLLIKPDIKQKTVKLPSKEFSVQNQSFDGNKIIDKPIFDERLKSGYGATKLLQKMIQASSKLDDYNEPVRLYLYMPTLGQNFLVGCSQFQLSMDRGSSNMMWKYNIQFTAIAPLEAVVDQDTIKKSLQQNLTVNSLQRAGTEAMNVAANTLREIFSTTPGNQ